MKEKLFYAGTADSLATDGKLWSKVKVLVNGENIGADVMAVKVKSGDNIRIEIETR